MKFLKPVKPITKGIQDLSIGEPVHIPEKGLLSDILPNQSDFYIYAGTAATVKKRKLQEELVAGVLMTSELLSMVWRYAGQPKDDEI